MKQQILLIATMVASANFSCSSQSQSGKPTQESTTPATVGGGCESCELMYIGLPENIPSTDTSDGWNEKGQRLLIHGTVYKRDGKTAAKDVILYYWQTDNNGLYSPAAGMDEKAKPHGHIRGWMKTDEQGRYSLYSIRPAAYPGTNNPQHIHFIVKEPGIGNEYYIDELQFDDDPLLTDNHRKLAENRGGNGIVQIKQTGALPTAERNITLGLNIPGYPKK